MFVHVLKIAWPNRTERCITKLHGNLSVSTINSFSFGICDICKQIRMLWISNSEFHLWCDGCSWGRLQNHAHHNQRLSLHSFHWTLHHKTTRGGQNSNHDL